MRYIWVMLSCVLLFAGVGGGLWAESLPVVQDGVPVLQDEVLPVPVRETVNRPQRAIRPDPRSAVPQFPRSPIPSPQSLFLTPEDLNRPLTMQYIARYSNTAGTAWINAVIRNGSVYLPYIKDEIARRGLPPELAYLPFIESGYVGTARSRSGATGLWQFMMNSIGSSMRVNDMVDERRDFRKSTAAALNKLEENYRALGNWPMALAAYNAGLAGARRAVQRARTGDYWEICEKREFKTETIHYVPKFLAVAHILSNPRRFNIDYWPESVEWTVITPGKQVSIEVLVTETGADRDLLYRLNHELLYGITPPDRNYELVVPSTHSALISAVLEREDLKLIQYYTYRIKYGDTLSALSRHYGVSVDLIQQHNPGLRNRYLQIGETLIIPAFRQVNPYSGGATPPSAPPVPVGPRPAFTGTHTVVGGDTLWSIANRYRVDPSVLAMENNMELNAILSIGKVLKVPIIE